MVMMVVQLGLRVVDPSGNGKDVALLARAHHLLYLLEIQYGGLLLLLVIITLYRLTEAILLLLSLLLL